VTWRSFPGPESSRAPGPLTAIALMIADHFEHLQHCEEEEFAIAGGLESRIMAS
jgi:hypothetical protein